ncbi:metal ABC transporter permease [Actinoalloteichus caeruleus]|uniref:Manganese/zinc/iron transport system permease protein n=1 Tax=Actinoalloteichus caeruleus DSM 43889 TaxID=1120930 RepID=A0ABT1JBN8_ACTCY|nr:metal ABC transporter permease [Actinoalloteichus caeruleus]MCP2329916.1 manganese/zinc/iron transport system permease protein [Actinoalloteichus caeruleus DSM 43889]
MNWLITSLPLPYPEAVVAVGAAVIGLVAGALGPLAVLRGRSMFGDAMSHGTLPGVVLGFVVAGTKNLPLMLLGAGLTAALAALAVIGLERYAGSRPDVAIGVVLSAAFTTGIVLLTALAGTGNAGQSGLSDYLFGQPAGMVERDVVLTLVVGGSALLAVAVWFRVLRTAAFDPGFAAVAGVPRWAVEAASTVLLAVAIVLGVRTVGAVLMVALLVAPAVAARQLTTRLGALLTLSAAVGATSGASGALLAGRAELPAGPVIVLLATSAAVLAVLFAPRRGVLVRTRRPRAAGSTPRTPHDPGARSRVTGGAR